MVSGRCLIAGGMAGFYVHVGHVLSHDWLLGLHGGDFKQGFQIVARTYPIMYCGLGVYICMHMLYSACTCTGKSHSIQQLHVLSNVHCSGRYVSGFSAYKAVHLKDPKSSKAAMQIPCASEHASSTAMITLSQ